ncbi:Transposon Ty3-G Gag-Pol polyprotein [Thelohanellus kitauei]|uniref:Transposon Ty3-G Gag-Pol polyprotein n=1 Tax=Thelohanellus kitauei TaxID=669202 RepID=A0A0C2ILJ7_THEKT|nr:Transposon Ty3-G Gag-Pol polyprotein [Thelohanellus kitauei]
MDILPGIAVFLHKGRNQNYGQRYTGNRPTSLRVKYNQKPVQALVDSGSAISVARYDLINNHIISIKPMSAANNIVLADGNNLKLVGIANLSIQINDRFVEHEFYIVETLLYPLIFGVDFLYKYVPTIDFYHDTLEIVGMKMTIWNTLRSEINTIDYNKLNSIIETLISSCDPSSTMKSDLQRILQSYSDILSLDEYDIGKCTLFEHKMDTNNACPIKQNSRRLSIHKMNKLKKLVDSLLRTGVIRRSYFSWSSPIVLIQKKCGGLRLCVDYRKLNNATISDAHPLPRIDETLDNLQGPKGFTTLDLSSGYSQIQVAEEDKHKTAFATYNWFF